MPKVTLIYNPDAGDEAQATPGQLHALIDEAGYKVRMQSVKEKGWTQALKKPAALVAVAGGDGTVGKVARRLIGRATPLAVLPMGTANNISKTLGIAERPVTQLIRGWPRARILRFDAGIAHGPWGSRAFVEGVGLGFFPTAIPAVEEHPTMEDLTDAEVKLTYAFQILRERLGAHEAIRLNAAIDGKDISGEYVLFEVMNTKYIGPNLYLAPDLLNNNGMFEVVCVERRHRKELHAMLAKWQEGEPWPAQFVTHPAKRVRFEWTGFPLHLDDKLWPGKDGAAKRRAPATIKLEVVRKSLSFLVPPEAMPKKTRPARHRQPRAQRRPSR